MTPAALVLSVAAILISGIGAVIGVRSMLASERSAKASEQSAAVARDADRRAREPRLVVTPQGDADPQTNQMFYTLRNDGPQDLESVMIHRPITSDGTTYRVRRPSQDYAAAIELGPLPITAEARFGLSIGTGNDRPDFRARIECVHGQDHWTVTRRLDVPPSVAASVW